MRKGITFFFCLFAVLILAACGSSTADRWQEQYDLGQKYLSELDYEQALLAFTNAIEIDPQRGDAYLEISKIYELQDNTEAAIEILEKASETTDKSEEIQERINSLKNSGSSERVDMGDGKYAVYEYDSQERLLKYTAYLSDDSIILATTYTYYEDGSHTEYTVYADGEYWNKEFDFNKKLVRENGSDSGRYGQEEVPIKWVKEYDDRERLISWTEDSDEHIIWFDREYQYSANQVTIKYSLNTGTYFASYVLENEENHIEVVGLSLSAQPDAHFVVVEKTATIKL